MPRGRWGKSLIWSGAVALAAALAAGAAPFLLPAIFPPDVLAHWLGGDALWPTKGPGFVTSELCGRWHPWALGLLLAAAVLVGAGGWVSARRGPAPGSGPRA